ncbi:hypothetical protein ACFOGJ_18695 [Marinibaculum pumilum]|uniref:Polysaccharide deacetylase n=1 Tax=Marinibaculum pumilum TaxID=1766165 RepID=A0ABV7L3T0_9PROT
MTGADLHDYPVDPVGYGCSRPDPAWPAGSGLAVQLSIVVPDAAPDAAPDSVRGAAEAASHGVAAATDSPERGFERARRAGVRRRRSTGYGSRVGIHRLRQLLRQHHLPATWFLAPSLAERLPAFAAGLVADGQEVALLGSAADLAGGQAAIGRLRDRLARVTGTAPVGWRSLSRHPDGRKTLVAAGGFLYDTDAADDDLPYWQLAAGRPLLVLPATPLAGRGAAAMARALARGRAEAPARPQCLRLEVDPDRLGRPDEAEAFAAMLAELASGPDLWVATAAAMARHWGDRFPFTWD